MAKKPRRPLCRELVGKMVVLTRDVTTNGGTTYAKGTKMLVDGTHQGTFSLTTVDSDGRRLVDGDNVLRGHIRRVRQRSFEVVEKQG